MADKVTFNVRDDVRGELERLALQFGNVHPSKIARRIIEEAHAQGKLHRLLAASHARFLTTKRRFEDEKDKLAGRDNVGGPCEAQER